MFKRAVGALLCVSLLPCAAWAADQVKVVDSPIVRGTVAEISPTEVVVENGALKKTLSVIDIEFIAFEDEPSQLKNARVDFNKGLYTEALASLNKIDMSEVRRREIKQDIEYYKAAASGRLALGGAGANEAGRLLLTFAKENGTSFHFFDVCEVLGDLTVSMGKYDKAEPYYAKLATAPWPSYKMRAAVLLGRSFQAQKEYPKAIAKFDEALAMDVKGKDAEKQRLNATLGKAVALAGSGKTDEAVKMVDEVIAKAEPESRELHARAYNALGNCLRSAGKKKEALLAFLHVDVLYSNYADQHAEALANLATLWGDVDKADRARDAKAQLKQKYATSLWAKSLE